MKKLVTVLGSSRGESLSARVAQRVMEAAAENGYETKVYYPGLMSIKGCLGCGACKRADTDCVIADDMQAYFKDLHTCDALLVAAPNYYGQVAGHMITFLNRHYCLLGPGRTLRLKPGIRLAGIFAQGTPASVPVYQPGYDWYMECFRQLGMESVGSIIIGSGSDLTQDGDVMKRAYEIGRAL